VIGVNEKLQPGFDGRENESAVREAVDALGQCSELHSKIMQLLKDFNNTKGKETTEENSGSTGSGQTPPNG
jgi:hypothetical protein